MAYNFEKVVIVTGGAQGIGKAIALSFLEKDHTVVITDLDQQAGNETLKELQPLGNIFFIKANNAQERDIKKVITTTLKKFQRLDILINNAGIFQKKSVEKLSLNEWRHVLDTNLTGAFLFAKYAAPQLRKKSGHIINICSTRAFMSEANTEAYSASKGGIFALTHALAISLGPEIKVNCISPGWIETSEWQKSKVRHRAKHSKADREQHPVGRVGKPEDIASLVLYLTSLEDSFVTGANFIVDGGMTKKMIYV